MTLRTHYYHHLTPRFPTLLRPPNLKSRPFYLARFLSNRTKTLIKCSDDGAGAGESSELASNLATEVAKMNNLVVQREEAMEKSQELLFRELCFYLSLEAEEVQKHWRKMEEEEKRVLVRGFVSDWGVNFHPLSARSVKELIEQHLRRQENAASKSSSSSALFPALKKMMGFSRNK